MRLPLYHLTYGLLIESNPLNPKTNNNTDLSNDSSIRLPGPDWASPSLYSGMQSFMGRPYYRDLSNPDVDIVVSGVPYDLATTGRSGARFGPQGIRAATYNLSWEEERWPYNFNVFEKLGVIDWGDVEFTPGDCVHFVEALESHADKVLEADKTMLTLGGDHYITLPLLRAHARKFGPMALIHFDAHTDIDEQGGFYDHGTMFHTALEEGLLIPEKSIQIGIRTWLDRAEHPYHVIDAAEANDMPVAEISQKIRDVVGETQAYLTFDIDCLDPAYAPGTGTPVCGGLTTDRAMKLIRGLKGLNIVGMDVAEVAPAYDHADITSLAGATLALEMLYLQANNRMS